jgi:hypothetical protein
MIYFLKIILSILLFLCLVDMPYGYYQFVRIISVICFAVFANEAYQKGNQNEMIFYIGLALLFQPFLKVALGRFIWNCIDVIIGVYLLFSLKKESKK